MASAEVSNARLIRNTASCEPLISSRSCPSGNGGGSGRRARPRGDGRHGVERVPRRHMIGQPVGWQPFEHRAAGYEAWYTTRRGRRASPPHPRPPRDTPFMMPCMKRLAVSTRDSIPPGLEIRSVHGWPVPVGRSREVLSAFYSRSSRTSPVSPSAQEGIRRVGAPSTRRPCNGGQGNIRAHPPIEPARDQGPHRQGVVDSVTCPRGRPPQRDDEDAERAGARTRCHRAAAHRGCRRGAGRGRRRPPCFPRRAAMRSAQVRRSSACGGRRRRIETAT